MGEEHYAVQDSGPARLCTFQEENISLSEFHQSTHRTIKKEHVNFPSMQHGRRTFGELRRKGSQTSILA